MNFHSFRKTDIGLVLSILLIIGALWKGYAKPASWDEAVAEVAVLKPKVTQCEKDIAEIRAINTTQMTLIIRELDEIHREMKTRREALRAVPTAESVAKG